MEVFVFHRDEYDRLYNCSMYSVEDVPLEKRQSVLLGFMFMVLFTIFELLYIPCLFAIRKHMDQTCYKLMFYIGITDVSCLWVNAFFTGYFAATGAVFCSHPTLIYITGVLGTSLWAAESTTDILLAVSRCVEMTSPHWGKVLFGGNRTWLWVIPPSLYGLYFAIFTKPVLFSGLFVSWFFNPHVGYIDDFGAVYHNDLHTFHNSFIFIGITVTYGLFGIILFAKTSRYDKRSSSQKMTFIQVMLISAVNAIASAIYIYMQFVRISEFIIVLGQFLWMCAHGIPAVIYLMMNKTMRNDCKKMFINWAGLKNTVSAVHAVSITEAVTQQKTSDPTLTAQS